MSEYIEVGQPLQFTDPNTPTRVGEIVENVSDIYNIPSPRLGMQVFVKSEKKSFVITSLKNKVIGGVDVPEAAVEAFEPVGAKAITWNNDTDPSNMNDFVVSGVYDIKGEHTRKDDNLPVLNTGGGHSFNARLTVLDSSITGSGKDDDKCITQVLSFSNRLGQGEVYIRTGKGSSLDNLTWEKWSTLQRNVNVGEVGSLDDLKDNGIYSGVWLFGSFNAYPLTFVCIVINDYFIGTAPRRISQFVYGLSKFDGSVVYQSRVWDDSKGKWGEWEILNKDEITSMITDAVDAATKAFNSRIDNLIDGAPETLDTLKEIADWITNDKTGAVALANAISANTKAITAERTRAIGQEGLLNNAIAAEKVRAEQAEQTIDLKLDEEIERSVAADQDLLRSIDEEARRATEAEEAIVENTDKKIAAEVDKIKDGDTIVGQAREIYSEDGRSLAGETRNFLDRMYDNTAKTDAKEVADYITNGIEGNKELATNAPNLALRALFVAAGAKYNDTDNVIIKTAPWGDSVEHLPGHYYLNGLGDITENEMSSIYVNSPNVLVESAYAEKKNRTFILNAGSSSVASRNYISGLFCNCNMAETIGNGEFVIYNAVPSGQVFYRCAKLKHINSKKIFGFGNISFSLWFSGCTALITCKIDRLAVDVSFLDSPNISYDSILYIINNIDSALKKSITITLHHDAYARLTADSNIVAALDAKNTLLASQGGKVSLVCAIHSEELIPNV